MELEKIRRVSGITQTELAKKVGVQQNTVSQWESGKRNIPSYLLPVLADVLCCTIDALFGRIPPSEAS